MDKLGLSYITYDVCDNNCFLYYKDGSDLLECPVCHEPRYKDKTNQNGKDVAKKQLWYFPITPRLQRLYMSRKTAEHMIWHEKCKNVADKVIHPAGSEAWKHFNRTHTSFAAEPRNVLLGLCTDGFNPQNNSAEPYSCWPVFVTPYNLPPDLCMNEEYIFVILIISGPKSPGVSIDVLMRPLIDELKSLWSDGACTFDSFKQQNFTMRVAVLWTISDFPAYGMLSGWSTHGKFSCPYCMEYTKSFWLTNGHKPCWFDCHRIFLPEDHPFRQNANDFYKDRVEMDQCKERRSGEEMLELVNQIVECQFGAKYAKSAGFGETHNWTKLPIMWELPYWSTLLIRNCLDVMHCQKNFFGNLKGTIFDDLGKTKDNDKARMDLPLYTKREELFLIDEGSRKCKATYTLDRDQRKKVCQWVKELKFPDGHVSNISKCVNLETNRISGMKSHDCHVFMQRLLPIAFRDFLPDHIWCVVTEVNNFFRALCAPEIKPADMTRLEESIVETLCKLERIFPPAFFDVMVHLAMHLPYEAAVGGPVFYRWMFPFERMMFHLKAMIRNKARVEACMAKELLVREFAHISYHYFPAGVDTPLTRLKRNEVRLAYAQFDRQLEIFIEKGRPMGKPLRSRSLTHSEYKAAMYYILTNCEEVDEWIRKFEDECGTDDPDVLQLRRINDFFPWFKRTIFQGIHRVDEMLHVLSLGASEIVNTYKGYLVNGFRFETKQDGADKTTLNSGICVKASVGGEDQDNYYGMLQEVIEMTFHGVGVPSQKIILFKCDWYDNNNPADGNRMHHLVDIDPRKRFPTNEPFILATQASQVLYATYPSTDRRRRGKWVVCPMRARHIIDVSSIPKAAHESQDYYQDDDPPIFNESVDLNSTLNVPVQLVDEEIQIVEPTQGNSNTREEHEEDDEFFFFTEE